MSLDLTVLKTELQSDPARLGYAGQSDYALAQILNAPNPAWTKDVPRVPIAALLKWGAGGAFANLADAAAAAGSFTAINPVYRSMCIAANRIFGAADALDLSDPAINNSDPNQPGMVQLLTTAGVLTPAMRDSLLALRNVAPASRAEVLFGAGTFVTSDHVSKALRGQ